MSGSESKIESLADIADCGAALEVASAEVCESFAARNKHQATLGRVLSTLIDFAAASAAAKRLRLKGEIREALRFEALADSCYDKLPQEARW
jgi:hypothetical protein